MFEPVKKKIRLPEILTFKWCHRLSIQVAIKVFNPFSSVLA